MTSIEARLRRVQRRNSRAARWCEWLAVFALPYLAIVILGHRWQLIETLQVAWLLGLGFAILCMALGFGVRAFYELWVYGNRGGLRALRGVTIAALLLLPFAFFAYRAVSLPQLHDISTDLVSPPNYDAAIDDRTDAMNPLGDIDPDQSDTQIRAYPKVAARRYPLGSGRVFKEVAALVADRDWTILTTQIEPGQAPIDEEGSALVTQPSANETGRLLRPTVPKPRPDSAAKPDQKESLTEITGPVDPVAVSPVARDGVAATPSDDERYIEAVAASPILGLESDVIIRLIDQEDGTLVDMRSASRWGRHDLGTNAARIIDFLNDLDLALQGQSGSG